MVEGVEGLLRRDRELEAVSHAGVLERDGESVVARVPEQEDADVVALTGRELAGLQCRGAHLSISLVEVHVSTLGAARRGGVAGKPDSVSSPATISAPTQVGGRPRSGAVLSAREPAWKPRARLRVRPLDRALGDRGDAPARLQRGRGGRAEHDALVLRAGGRADGDPARRASAVPLRLQRRSG